MATLLSLRISLCTITLFIHQAAESIFIHFQTFFASHLKSQIEWEAIGVMELEYFISWKNALLACLQLCRCKIKDCCSSLKSLQERFFFSDRDCQDSLLICDQLWILGAHCTDCSNSEFRHDGIVDSHKTHITNSSTHHAAQHITTAFIAGSYSIANEHR